MDFTLKKGIVLSKRSKSANYFIVRVMPDMAEVQEVELLPTYPCFFGEDSLAFNSDEEVWLLTSQDFTIGYILGKYTTPRGVSLSPLISTINEAEEKAGFVISQPQDISIRSIGGRSILFENIANGQSGQIYNTKVVHLYGALGESFMMYPNATFSVNRVGDMSIVGKSLKQDFTNVEVDASSVTQNVGSMETISKGSIINNASGPIKEVTASYKQSATTSDSTELVAKKKKETYGLGQDTKIVAGGHSETILVGSYNLNVVGGKIELKAGLGVSILATDIDVSGAAIRFSAPFFKAPAGGVVAPGLGPLCALPFCLATGAPHSGNIQVGGV